MTLLQTIDRKLRSAYRRWLKQQMGTLAPCAKVAFWLNLQGDASGIHIHEQVNIGRNATFKCNKGSTITVGAKSFIGPNSMLMTYGGDIKLGNRVSVNPFCILYGHGGLTIGSNVRIAAHTVIIPANHNFEDVDKPITDQGVTAKGVEIEDDVWIGTRATILDGVKIGKGSVIGAGSVVTKDVAPYTVVAGVPAKPLRKRGDMPGESSLHIQRALLYEVDPPFQKLYKQGAAITDTPERGDKRKERFYNLTQLLQQTYKLDGAIAECGCWKGLSSYLMNHYLKDQDKNHQGERFYVLDSFEGLSEPTEQDVIAMNLTERGRQRKGKAFKEGGAYAASLEHVQQALSDFPKVQYIKGWIPQSLSELPDDEKYRFVHIDVDLYDPIKGAFEYFYPKMVSGGIMVCDDYGSLFWPGAKQALDEFAQEHGVQLLSLSSGQGVIFKP